MSTRSGYFRGVARQAPAGAAVLRPRTSPRREPPATPRWTSSPAAASQMPVTGREPVTGRAAGTDARRERLEGVAPAAEKDAAAVRDSGGDNRVERRGIEQRMAEREGEPAAAMRPVWEAPGAVREDAVRAEAPQVEARDAEEHAGEQGMGPFPEAPEAAGRDVVAGEPRFAAVPAAPARVIPGQERAEPRRPERLLEVEQEGVPLRFWTQPAAASAAVSEVRDNAAPTLHIGSIEIEVAPPAAEPAQAASARVEGKGPLSRGYSRLYGWGQS